MPTPGNLVLAAIQQPADLASLEPADIVVSFDYLSSLPPPIQRLLLEASLQRLAVGGFCLVQTLDWIDGYRFANERFLSDAGAPASHCLPKTTILRIFEAHGMRLLDFAPDRVLARAESCVYFARKLRQRSAS
jgi:hypothetical protein